MNKIERVDSVINNMEVDRPPVSLWYHFGLQHSSGECFAKTTLDFFDYYDFDFLKVMNDYYYPTPEGIDGMDNKEALKRFVHMDIEKSIYKEQFKALEIINKALKGKAYFIDTVFDPFFTIKRMAREHMPGIIEDEPEALLEALNVLTDNLITYCKKSLSLGSAGIFMSVPAAKEWISREEFLKFEKPFVMRLFEEISGLGKLNTAHIHGEDLLFEDILDLPVPILNWWDRGPNGPSLKTVKDKFAGCVMGGIDHKIVPFQTKAFLKRHTQEGIKLGGKKRFLLSCGCSVDSCVNPELIGTIMNTVKGKA